MKILVLILLLLFTFDQHVFATERGSSVSFYDNGALKSESFRSGVKGLNQEFRSYYQNGQLQFVLVFQDDILIDIQIYDKSGTLIVDEQGSNVLDNVVHFYPQQKMSTHSSQQQVAASILKTFAVMSLVFKLNHDGLFSASLDDFPKGMPHYAQNLCERSYQRYLFSCEFSLDDNIFYAQYLDSKVNNVEKLYLSVNEFGKSSR